VGVGAGLYMYDVVAKKFTFAISSPDEFLLIVPPLLFADSRTCDCTPFGELPLYQPELISHQRQFSCTEIHGN